MSVIERALRLMVLSVVVSIATGCATNVNKNVSNDDVNSTDGMTASSEVTPAVMPDGTLAEVTRTEVTNTDVINTDIDTAAEMDSDIPTRDGVTRGVAKGGTTKEVTTVAMLPEISESKVGFLKLDKTETTSGTVLVGTSDAKTKFEIKQTAPSEYVLTIKDSTLSEGVTPKISMKGAPGIRSARASETNGNVSVRMFVDSGTTLSTKMTADGILVTAENSSNILSRTRGQLAEKKDEAPPVLKAVDKDKLPTSSVSEKPDDNVARENPTGFRSADGSKIYTGRLISLDLQDTDIDNALRIIAEVSNLNIIASDDVTGKVTLRLIDVPWDQALDVILKTNGLDQVTEGNVIRIAPVDKLRQEREALKELQKAQDLLENLTVNYLRVSYSRVADIKEQVEAVLTERGTVAVDERTNQLIIKDIAKGHKEAIALIKKLDLRTPQVLLETQVVESSRNILRDLGFQWGLNYSQAPATGNATGLNFPNAITLGGSTGGANSPLSSFPAVISGSEGSAISMILDSADGSKSLSARLSALEKEGSAKVISRPQIATVNNKRAEIKSVKTLRVKLPNSGTSIATGSGASAAGGGATAFQEIPIGIELSVTPQASPDYYVLLDVHAKSSTLGSAGEQVDNIPPTIDREATSTILVKSGQTFALGGVYKIQEEDGVAGMPFLKDIPIFGQLFRRVNTSKADEELIFFITPHIVEGSFDETLMQPESNTGGSITKRM